MFLSGIDSMIRKSSMVAIIVVVPVMLLCWQLALSEETTGKASSSDAKLFQGWGKPDVALLITGRQHGYIEPCGCTGLANQRGGLARRYTLLKQLRAKGWDVVSLDAGNQVRRFGAQAAAKFQSTVDGLREMDYRAVGLGPDDLRLSAGELYAALADPEGQSTESDIFICANVDLFGAGIIGGSRVIETGGMKIGVAAVLGTNELKRVTQSEVTKRAPMEALKATMAEIKQLDCDFQVLLSHASLDESRLFAKAFPQLDLVVTTGGAGEPTFRPEEIAGTKAVMIQAGTKGMYAGVVGIFRDGTEDKLRYQRIPLDARFEDSREMLDLLAAYQDKLKEQGIQGLGLTPVRHPSGRKYVGSEACGDCHTQAYEKWLTTPHHHATVAISDPNERSEIPRHFDPECISCHVTGWNPQQFIPYDSGYLDLEQSVAMHGNGCENCHGPGSAHVAAENGELDDLTDELIETYREQMRLPLTDARAKCLECHDLDNDPHFHEEGMFDKYWEQVAHPWSD